jgi:hypothetical protein
MNAHSTLERLIQSLPENFPFYHLGEVQLDVSQATPDSVLANADSDDRLAIAYSLQGELRGLLAVIFEQGLDISTYSELGNIIASRMATQLEAEHGLAVSISPPRILSSLQFKNLLKQGGPHLARIYQHQHQGQIIPLRALVMSTEGTGHA